MVTGERATCTTGLRTPDSHRRSGLLGRCIVYLIDNETILFALELVQRGNISQMPSHPHLSRSSCLYFSRSATCLSSHMAAEFPPTPSPARHRRHHVGQQETWSHAFSRTPRHAQLNMSSNINPPKARLQNPSPKRSPTRPRHVIGHADPSGDPTLALKPPIRPGLALLVPRQWRSCIWRPSRDGRLFASHAALQKGANSPVLSADTRLRRQGDGHLALHGDRTTKASPSPPILRAIIDLNRGLGTDVAHLLTSPGRA